MSLFGGSTTRAQSKNLVEFKAGKMTMKGKMVHPDKRKGLVYVYQSDDSLMHFCWKDRTTGKVDDDLIIFPDDVEYKHVPQCTTGRVYLLKFKSARKLFFWMQEPKADKDEENCKKVNEYLNNPPTPGSSRGGGGAGSGGGGAGLPPELAAGLGDGDLQNLLRNMSQQQLMQLLGGMGIGGSGGGGGLSGLSQQLMGHGGGGGSGRTTSAESNTSSRVQSAASTAAAERPATAASTTSAGSHGGSTTNNTDKEPQQPQGVIQLSDLQNILSGIGAGGATGGGGGGAPEAVDLSTAITPEAMIPILANKDVQAKLIPHLPKGESLPQSEEELRATVNQPQFQQAMSSFSAALASGQLGPLMGQFDLEEDVANAAAQGDVEAFARAMQAALDKKKDEKSGEEKMEEDKA